MSRIRYEVTQPFGGFKQGEVLCVTARFGDWHAYDLKLEPERAEHRTKTVVVTEHDAGFGEAEILDETARIGDWHECGLAFEPGAEPTRSGGRIEITADQLSSVTKLVES